MPVKIFYSYSHKDESFRDELSTCLGILKHNNKIEEWHDRQIKPGTNYNTDINDHIESTDIVIFLVSPDFLNSDYCFGIEVEKALALQKQHKVEIVPVLIKPCLYDESRFSQLQIIPRDARPVTSWPSKDDAFNAVAIEIRKVVDDIIKRRTEQPIETNAPYKFDSSLDLVRGQVTAYANLYERIRQQMQPGSDRTVKMQDVFNKMNSLATASYPLLEELSKSPLPGERLAAIAVLQNFADENYFDFLAETMGKEKPFVGYQAVKALRFAVGSVAPRSYDKLFNALTLSRQKLISAEVGFDADRHRELEMAVNELKGNIAAFQSQKT